MNFSIKNNLTLADVEFSFAVASDIDALLVIENQSFQFPWPHQHFQSEIDQPYSCILLARQPVPTSRNILGYLVFWLIIDEMHILNLAVSPDFRRQGIGRSLLLEAFGLARAKHCQTAWLEVRPSNSAALFLYQSFGFKPVMTRKRYYSDTGEDAIILSCSL